MSAWTRSPPSSSPSPSSPPPWSSSTSPASSPAPPRAKASATSSSATSAPPTPSATSSAASTTPKSSTSPAASTRSPTSTPSTPSSCSPTSTPSKSARDASKSSLKNTQDSKIKSEGSAVAKLKAALEAGKPARTVDLTDDEKRLAARDLHLITAKPQLYVANVDEAALATGNAHTAAVEQRAKEEGSEVVRICGALESEIALLDPESRAEFLKDLGLAEPGLDRLIHAAYRLLGLITYFTAGVQEVRAWTITEGTKAPGAAGVIHTDFERGFIKADAYPSAELFRLGSEQAVKEAGLLRSEGKDYVVKDGDILFFKFNV